MKKAIRFGILFAIGFGLVALTKQLEITHDAEGELKWIPVAIILLVALVGGGWLDRKVLQRLIPD